MCWPPDGSSVAGPLPGRPPRLGPAKAERKSVPAGLCLTVTGIPFGITNLKLAGRVLAPFGQRHAAL